MRYLTKSKFKLALQCLTKLYYASNDEYMDQSLDDPFLEALAEGGFQVGELAKYHFSEDPIRDHVTIETLSHDEALVETQKRMSLGGRTVIAEAAFQHNSFFIRTDIIVKEGKRLDLYEVKAKSIDHSMDGFYTKKGQKKIRGEWVEYLYDIAFQKYVLAMALEKDNLSIFTHLILVDKDKTTSVDGLNQKFKVIKGEGGRKRIEVQDGLTRASLGQSILRIVDVDEEIQKIWDEFPVPTNYADSIGFEEFIAVAAEAYLSRKRIFTAIGMKCRDCEFVNHDAGPKGMKSGFHECWEKETGYKREMLNDGLVLELWGGLAGGKSIIQELIDKRIYRIEDINCEADISANKKEEGNIGLSPSQRRVEQISREREKSKKCFFDKKGMKEEMSKWRYPLHMIDFETTMTALPFHSGRHPYEGIAFQFSHHKIEKDWNICHTGQYLSFEPGIFPNYEFVRELRAQLQSDDGSIFRYHNHENTYLNLIYDQLEADENPPKDAEQLKSFIRDITKARLKTDQDGPRCMIDLYQLVLRYYYSPRAKGSNSIKAILPALIADSQFLCEKYGRTIYGKNKDVKSLNFEEHIWINPKYDNDPYKSLPRLFSEYDEEKLDSMLPGLGEIREGGAAMVAFNYLQFSRIPQDQREALRNGLLRYCELDTMAMVMIVEGWKQFCT